MIHLDQSQKKYQSMNRYQTYDQLKKFIDKEIQDSRFNDDYSLPYKPNAKQYGQYLRNVQLIDSRQQSGRGSAEEMKLSPIGKLIAIYIETKLSTSW